MKKALKFVLVSLAAAAVLLIGTIVVISFLFDANAYRGQITQAVKDATGRDLKIGDIQLSFFPWVGVDLRAVELSNAPGFGREPFVEMKSADIKVKLLPLLSGKVVANTVTLKGAKFRLAKNHAGRTNWADLTEKKPAPAPEPPKDAAAPTPAAKPGEGFDPASIAIGGLVIKAAELVWDDQQSGARYAVHTLNLKTGSVALPNPIDLDLSFELESTAPPMKLPVGLKTRLAFDPKAQTLDVSRLTLKLGELSAGIKLKGEKLLEQPQLSGQIEIAPFNARTLLTTLGVKYETADPTALTQVGLKADLSYTGSDAAIKGLTVTLDQTTLTGALQAKNLAKPELQADLALTTIDVDRYLPPPAPKTTAKAPVAAAAAPAPAVDTFPYDAVRALNADAALKIAGIKVAGLQATDLVFRLKAKNGVIQLQPLDLKLYGGSSKGNIGVDASRKPVLLSIEENLTNVRIGDLLKDLKIFDKFTGTGNVQIKLAAQGATPEAVLGSLAGKVGFRAADGRIDGADIARMIQDARTKAAAAKGKAVPAAPAAGDRTAFSNISGTLVFLNGVGQNGDLSLVSPALKADGKGVLDLPKQTLDYHLRATVVNPDTKKETVVPVTLSGPLASLKYGIEWGALVKEETKQQVKEKAKEKLGDKLQKYRK